MGGKSICYYLSEFQEGTKLDECVQSGADYFPKVITIFPVLLCSSDVTMAFLLSGGWSYFSLLSNPDELLTMVEVLLYDF